jgi:hypothetical protein
VSIPNTRAKIRLTAWDVEQLLDLPDGYQVLYVGTEFDPSSFAVVVVADCLPEVNPACELPLLHGSLSHEYVTVNGKVYVRWAWTPNGPEVTA